MSMPNQCVMDTNVPKTANLLAIPDSSSDVTDSCILACIEAVEHVMHTQGLIIDAGDDIFNEYLRQLETEDHQGAGTQFIKWVIMNSWNPDFCQRVAITKAEDSYQEFPNQPGLESFDPDDKMFVAVANAHPDKPPILQATDSQWWGWQEPLAAAGITVHFVCSDYIKSKHQVKTSD